MYILALDRRAVKTVNIAYSGLYFELFLNLQVIRRDLFPRAWSINHIAISEVDLKKLIRL